MAKIKQPEKLPLSSWLKQVVPVPGERRRFRAPSRSGGDTWFVDLEENNFAGQCDCPDYRCRKRRCWHIKLCMLYWYYRKIREESAQDNPSGKKYIGP